MTPAIQHLYAWMRDAGVDPSEITVVLRAATPEQEMLLTQAVATEYIKQASGSPHSMSYPTSRAYNLRIAGLDVIVTTLDASARQMERGK